MLRSMFMTIMVGLMLVGATVDAADPIPPCAPANPLFDSCTMQYPGDANGDGFINAADARYLNDFLRYGGPAPNPLANGDFNGDCVIDCDDVGLLIRHVFFRDRTPADCTCPNPDVVPCVSDTCPARVAGDIDGDGVFNVGDAARLYTYLQGGYAYIEPIARADVNGDGWINFDDYNCLAGFVPGGCTMVTCTDQIPQTIIPDTCGMVHPGDADGDGFVTEGDLAYLADFLCSGGPAPVPLSNGDANGDCIVDGLDVMQIQSHLSGGGATLSDCTCQTPTVGSCSQDCRGALSGDANGDGRINIGDAVYVVNAIFCGPAPKPYPTYSGDANGDCRYNVGDAVYLVNYLFRGGPGPLDCATWLGNCGGYLH